MIWPPHSAYLGDELAPLCGKPVRDLTPRRLGYLEAIDAPCMVGGEETRETVGAELAIITGPLWLARKIVSGSEVFAWFAARFYAPKRGTFRETVRRLSVWIRRQLWSPPRYYQQGEEPTRSSWGPVTPTALQLVATAYRLGLGSTRRDVRGSAWDASIREIIALSVADSERNGAEFGNYEEHLEAQRHRKQRKGGRRHGK